MILHNINSKRKDSGFTIVELLVVIVVIGILAAITIVSYTGITARAKAAQTQANANSILQVVNAYTADATANGGGNGAFTSTISNITSYSSTKLPSGVTITAAAANHPVSTDVDGNGIGIIYYAAKSTTGACIAYWDTGKAAVSTLFMGDAGTFTVGTGVCS